MDSDASDAPSGGSFLDGIPEGPRRTMWALAVDRVAVEVLEGLEGVGIVLLKGPSIARWLYEPGERAYVDIDLLVDPAHIDRAGEALSAMGFTTDSPPQFRLDRPSYREWTRRSDEPAIDLHPTLNLLEHLKPVDVWRTLSTNVEPFDLLGREVAVLAPGARAFHLALHALHHGEDAPQAQTDLTRALERLDFGTWADAARVATNLSAEPILAVALRESVDGRTVADRLGLPDTPPTSMAIRGQTRSGGTRWAALGVEWWSGLSRSERFSLILRKMFPGPAYLRARSRVARKGGVWVLVAYVARPFVVLGWGARGAATWMRARRGQQ